MSKPNIIAGILSLATYVPRAYHDADYIASQCETPADIIARIVPDVLVKGAQYEIHEIAGHDTVLNNGGKVETLELVEGISTSELINRIKKL